MSIYLGTGGYSDDDLVGVLYPDNAKKSDYLRHYADNYRAVEVNSSFYAPIGRKAFEGMLEKSHGQLQFGIKLHQDFSHHGKGTAEHAAAFIEAIEPIQAADKLAALLLQFPHSFDRTANHRQYLAQVVSWFEGVPLTIEFRHPSWHTEPVIASFRQQGLIWCSVDYPNVQGLPQSDIHLTTRRGYLRLHGQNLNWWEAYNAAERHDYRYTEQDMQQLATQIAAKQQEFDDLFVFFQNTVKGHAVYNIAMLRQALQGFGLNVQ